MSFSTLGASGYSFPVPLATHEDVIKDSTFFLNTLRGFNFAMGTTSMNPVIGGKELNLYMLYIEVTKRGGYDQVVAKKKWSEVSAIFEFSPTTTSASYALRKHYFKLLYGYEKAYFFRNQCPTLGSTAPSTFQAIGTIEGKFDCGYLVSIKFGEEILRGVLYHPKFFATNMQFSNPIIPNTQQPPHGSERRTKRRGRDPTKPKPNLSSYNYFFAEKHSELKLLHPNKGKELTKMIAESWNKLSPEEKMVYDERSSKDKERYLTEMEEYERRQTEQTC